MMNFFASVKINADDVGVHKTDPASIQALNDYHHDKYDVPAADVLRNAWDTSEPLFIAIYGAP